MKPANAELKKLKQRMRSTWMAGDFGQIAQYSAKAAEEFVGRLGIRPAAKVLDGGCGHGTSSIPAARAGAKVTGIDSALNLLEQAWQRSVTEGLDATFDEGDAEQLPCADGQFDVVMTMFGAMFAPRPERVAAELVRACRFGGTIAMANWTPDGIDGRMFANGARLVPPPDAIPSPLPWGGACTVTQRPSSGTSADRTAPHNSSSEC